MNTENQRAADEFRSRLQALHARGDVILAKKGKLVKSFDENSAAILAIVDQFNGLRRLASDTDQQEAFETFLASLESVSAGVKVLQRSWKHVEQSRAEILSLRKRFDAGHLERIANGQRKADSDVLSVADLDALYNPLRDEAADFSDACDRQCDEDDTNLSRVKAQGLQTLYSELKQETSTLLDQLVSELDERKRWIDLTERQYVGEVTALDLDYQQLRIEMEAWEPLS